MRKIRELLVLDVKDADWFESRGWTNQHGGGACSLRMRRLWGGSLTDEAFLVLSFGYVPHGKLRNSMRVAVQI